MTTANQRGGYIKKLSVSRDGASTSITTFRDMFLKKTNNYVLQCPRFVTNVTPYLNLIKEVMFEILPRGNVGVLVEDVPFVGEERFIAKPYRSWSELARQLQVFFKAADVELGDENQIQFALLDDGCFRLKLSPVFCDAFYIKVGPETQKKTGFPEYIFQVYGTDDSDIAGDITRNFNHTDDLEYLFYDDDGELSFAVYQAAVTEDLEIESRYPLDSFDTRISLDVTATFPISSKISGFNGIEQREYILARFPLTDYKKTWSEVSIEDDDVRQGNTVSEKIRIGLADLTRTNSEMISVFMLPGEIYHANFQLDIRYFSEGKIISVPADMENGFWHLEMIFSKKKT